MLTTRWRSAVIVRERVRGIVLPADGLTPRCCTEREFDALVRGAKSWPLDFVLLTLTHGEAGTVRLTCGRWGTAPIYLHAADGVLRGDWDVAELYPHLRSTMLDPGFVARCLVELDHPYSRKTIFPEIGMLTERASASWSAPFNAPKIHYPRAEPQATAMGLKPGADVEGTMHEILTASMRRWVRNDDEDIAIELSGGLDSSTVAAAAASLTRKRVLSYGMIMPGRSGVWQSRRRDAVVRCFRMRDRNFPCLEEPPFNPRSRRVRDDATIPWGEFYDEAVGALLKLVREDGARLIFTGMGGDELCSYQLGEDDDEPNSDNAGSGLAHRVGNDCGESFPRFLTARTIDAFEQSETFIDEAPQSLLYTSTLESAAAVSTLYLRHGVWPVSPLVTPELVQFCRRLPFELRRGRVVQRRLLTFYGLGKTVAYPNSKHLEDFSDVMTFAMREAAVPAVTPLFEESRLAEQGFVDRRELVNAYRAARAGDGGYHSELLGAAVLELTLRAVEGRRKRLRAPRAAALAH
jgi:asparagine synthase (glutamine-hydrolysing)